MYITLVPAVHPLTVSSPLSQGAGPPVVYSTVRPSSTLQYSTVRPSSTVQYSAVQPSSTVHYSAVRPHQYSAVEPVHPPLRAHCSVQCAVQCAVCSSLHCVPATYGQMQWPGLRGWWRGQGGCHVYCTLHTAHCTLHAKFYT